MRAPVFSVCLSAVFCFSIALCSPALAASQSGAAHPAGHGAPQGAADYRNDPYSKVPQFLLDGLDYLRHDTGTGPEEAARTWLKGSALSQNSGISSNLRSYKQSDGEYEGFQAVLAQDLTQRIRVIYISLDYERSPHIVKFVTYRTSGGYILLSINMNLDETALEAALAQPPAAQ